MSFSSLFPIAATEQCCAVMKPIRSILIVFAVVPNPRKREDMIGTAREIVEHKFDITSIRIMSIDPVVT